MVFTFYTTKNLEVDATLVKGQFDIFCAVLRQLHVYI